MTEDRLRESRSGKIGEGHVIDFLVIGYYTPVALEHETALIALDDTSRN